jgi:ABC-type dipeptide/oligopeptide/nickel transport system permease subunit
VTPLERYGRILLAAAVFGLFLTVVASMIAGSFLTPLIVVVVVAGVAGYLMMTRGQRR